MDLPAGFMLRPASPDEAELLRDVMLRCWAGTVADNSSAYRETVADIAGQLSRGGAVLLFRHAEAVGGGRYHPVAGPAGDAQAWVELKRVGVLAELRGQALGAPLVGALERAAQDGGYGGSQIGVRSDQPRLLRFWEGLGYRQADDVQLHTVNPLTPKPFTLRKWFAGCS